MEWDGWPDGDFSALFSMRYVEKNDNLHVHWATRPLGGRGGTTHAESWQDGKLTQRQCQGVLECDDDECSEREIFAAIVKEQPKVGPLPLVVGHATADGPAPSVANISPALVNTERVKYERRKVLVPGSGGYRGDNFVKEFAKFAKSNPNFIRTSHFGQVAVIIMQTPFMASRLIKSVPVLDHDAVGGLVSDAAHGFWKEGNSQLIITSTYEPVHLKCWVPVLITYSNGGTEQHYQLHFFELFLGFAEECQRREIVLTDDMLANVSLEDFLCPKNAHLGIYRWWTSV
ncbi:hypothetical protein B0H14DRAFT_2368599 [Mycena olivaceomarginata]|nr:hypothetical protein B0H14DRAFT_2368599 [Mycena olivaceomarginata]